ncbi:MAG: LemA family protein [Bacilli bacterium]|nr:LemA family protein [Bacilli bacterium]
MNGFLIALFIIITLIIILLITYIHIYNKINESIIRIEEAESRIDNNLRDKYDLLNRSISLIRNKIELGPEAFKEIIKLRARKISNFDLDRILVKSYNEFLSIYEANLKLRESDEIFKVSRQLEIINDELLTLRNYYNANITNYNKMIKKFPTNIVANIKKYKERPFYDLKDMTDEDYEDFKL